MTILTNSELSDLEKIENTYYMIPILIKLKIYQEKYGLIVCLDYLYEILNTAKNDVEILLDERINEGIIKDKAQARKPIVGNAFSLLIKYIILKLKEQKIINSNIFITSNPKKHKLISDIVTIKVDGETQKPDMDLAIYSINEKK